MEQKSELLFKDDIPRWKGEALARVQLWQQWKLKLVAELKEHWQVEAVMEETREWKVILLGKDLEDWTHGRSTYQRYVKEPMQESKCL